MKTSVFSFVAVLLISFVTLAQSMNGKVTLGGELSINSQELKYEIIIPVIQKMKNNLILILDHDLDIS